MTKLETKLIKMSYQLLEFHPGHRFRHYTFITRRTTIINVGLSFSRRSHPISKKYHYRCQEGLHSEGHAVVSFPYHRSDLPEYDFWNVRVNNRGEISQSRPCCHCQVLLKSHGINQIMHTNENGVFEKFNF